jgi:hypothetical protein
VVDGRNALARIDEIYDIIEMDALHVYNPRGIAEPYEITPRRRGLQRGARRSRRDYLRQIHRVYRVAGEKEKRRILDELPGRRLA